MLATFELGTPGGIQTYLLTIAPHLERLGHHVTLYAPKLGAVADLARSRGLRVAGGERELPVACDAVVANEAVSALTLADRYPEANRVIVVHGADFDVHLPPVHDGVVSCAIAMNDVVQRRLEAGASRTPIVRLRQPVELARFRAPWPIREAPESVLILSNYLGGERRQALIESCERAGLRWRQVGVDQQLLDPVPAINEADIVVGQGRAVLEAMSCGRAGWVFGPSGGDGWVTDRSYPALESDGFRARASNALESGASFTGELKRYRQSMGEFNRALIVRHHSAYDHVAALASLLARETAVRPAPGPLREMARLVRTQFDAQARVDDVLAQLRVLRDDADRRITELEEERRVLVEELARVRSRLQRIVETRRWRAVNQAARPLERARAILRGR